MKRIAFVAAALALMLSACKSMDVDHDDRFFRTNHFIQVWVSTDSGVPTIHVGVEKLHIPGPGHVIFWILEDEPNPGYAFPANGIAFKTPEGIREFECDRLHDHKFKCRDLYTQTGGKEFEYGVTLAGSPAVKPLDPWIVNR